MTRRAVWITAGAAAAAVVLGVSAYWFLLRPPGPDVAARAYLDALAAGDGERALSLVQAPDDGVDRAAILAGAAERIEAPEVIAVGFPANTDLAGAAVRFTLGGEVHELSLTLGPDGSGGWRVLDTGLGAADVSTSIGDAVDLGGVEVAPGRLTLLPAIYTARATPSAILTGEARVTILPSDLAPAAVEATLAPGAVALAQEQLDAYVATCTQPATSVPDACGLRIPWASDLRDVSEIRYRIEASPAVSFTTTTTFAATGGRVAATVTGTGFDGAPASVTYAADDWSLSGTIGVEGGSLLLRVR